jgi:hypothetical protein
MPACILGRRVSPNNGGNRDGATLDRASESRIRSYVANLAVTMVPRLASAAGNISALAPTRRVINVSQGHEQRFVLSCYRITVNSWAHSRAIARSGDGMPGNVAQPPF